MKGCREVYSNWLEAVKSSMGPGPLDAVVTTPEGQQSVS